MLFVLLMIAVGPMTMVGSIVLIARSEEAQRAGGRVVALQHRETQALTDLQVG